ncbi:PucR family transcriptional regulator [Agathobacter sp.]
MFQCKDLLSLTTMSQAKVIAGSGGMEKGIRWSYKAENINFEKWVRGKELLIVSGPVTQRKNFDLYKTIKKAIELNMSCALLLVGENYVTQIDKKVIDLAENNDFPLFTMPWDVPLLDFFEELGHAISYLDDRKDIEDSLLAEIIFGNCTNTSSVEQKCRQMGYDPCVLEQVFVLHLSEKCPKDGYGESKYTDGENCLQPKGADEHTDKQSDKYIRKSQSITNDKIRSYAQTLKEYFDENNYPAIVSCYGDRIIGFMKDCTDDRKKIIDIFQQFGEFLQNDLNGIEYTLNIGEKCESISKLQKSFHETSKTNSVLEHINRKNETVFYDEMGFYRLLMSYENTAPMQRFVDEVLEPVIQYEKKAHTQLMETMWAYFECDCNLQRTAEKLFSHKNTVKYRLQRIEQLTGKSFASRFQSQELYNALMIYYFLE